MLGGLAAAIAARKAKLGDDDASSTLVSAGLGLGPSTPSTSAPAPRRASLGIHAGLANQGATCYLNSLLQTLYACQDFRLQVLAAPAGSGPVTAALQALFAELLRGARGAASTRALTASFGWDGSEAYEQHDASEALVGVLDALQRAAREAGAAADARAAGLRHAGLAECIASAHTGGVEHTTTCRGCGTAARRGDAFLALLLPVRGSGGGVHGALRAFAAEEALEGDNRYECGVCGGKREAVRAAALSALPLHLLLHLNRHEYDLARRARRKVEEPVAPVAVLDVAPYCSSGGSGGSEGGTVYDLTGALLHSGGAMGGHYYAHLRTAQPSAWLCCNDSAVSVIPPGEVAGLLGLPVEVDAAPEGGGWGGAGRWLRGAPRRCPPRPSRASRPRPPPAPSSPPRPPPPLPTCSSTPGAAMPRSRPGPWSGRRRCCPRQCARPWRRPMRRTQRRAPRRSGSGSWWR